MHPGDNTGALIINICLIEGFSDKLVCDKGRLPDNFNGKNTACVKLLYAFIFISSSNVKIHHYNNNILFLGCQ